MTLNTKLSLAAVVRCALVLGLASLAGESTTTAAEYASYFQTDACAEQRAGHPQQVKRIAAPSNTRNYSGYYVGGGSTFAAGHERSIDQGTWGWDYGGLLKNNWVRLGWNNGSRPQGGTGSYKTNFAPFQK